MSGLAKFCPALALLLFISRPVHAEIRIAVLDFELVDLTEFSRGAAETDRTASLKPLLESSLAARGFGIVPTRQAAADSAIRAEGYLWDHPDEVAAQWSSTDAQFVVVGRVSKPSYLFVYFEARIIDVKTGGVVDEVYVEVKGQQNILTPKGIENMARRIQSGLDKLRTAPATDSGAKGAATGNHGVSERASSG